MQRSRKRVRAFVGRKGTRIRCGAPCAALAIALSPGTGADDGRYITRGLAPQEVTHEQNTRPRDGERLDDVDRARASAADFEPRARRTGADRIEHLAGGS